MNPSQSEKSLGERITPLHAWYQANVLAQRLTPEVERLWLSFFKQGYNGKQLARVVRYLRSQISLGKRNEGCLLLRNLLGPDESGSLTAFDEALALASGRKNLQVDRKLAPLPEGETEPETMAGQSVPAPLTTAGREPQPTETEAMRARRVQELEELRRNLA